MGELAMNGTSPKASIRVWASRVSSAVLVLLAVYRRVSSRPANSSRPMKTNAYSVPAPALCRVPKIWTCASSRSRT